MGNSDHGTTYTYIEYTASRVDCYAGSDKTVIYESNSGWIGSSGNPKVRAAALFPLCSRV